MIFHGNRIFVIVKHYRTNLRMAIVRPMDQQLDNILSPTMNDVPGYEVTAVHGEVFGLIVRARNVFSNFGASLRTLIGGEVGGYTQLLSDSRNHAIERLRKAAHDKGGNAVLAMRF